MSESEAGDPLRKTEVRVFEAILRIRLVGCLAGSENKRKCFQSIAIRLSMAKKKKSQAAATTINCASMWRTLSGSKCENEGKRESIKAKAGKTERKKLAGSFGQKERRHLIWPSVLLEQ